MMLIQHSVNSDWLFNTQARVLLADLFILEINEKATLCISMPYSRQSLKQNMKILKICKTS